MMSDCDLWEGGKVRNSIGQDYGRLHIAVVDGKQIQMAVHRLVWMQTHGQTDLHILHSCDTPACINIDHLRAGTPADNARDKMERGRWSNGRSTTTTHCHNGHKYDESNTYIRKTGTRNCRECAKATMQRFRKLRQSTN